MPEKTRNLVLRQALGQPSSELRVRRWNGVDLPLYGRRDGLAPSWVRFARDLCGDGGGIGRENRRDHLVWVDVEGVCRRAALASCDSVPDLSGRS